MEIEGRHVVVTGGASGIGRALAQRFVREKARAVVVADLEGEAVRDAATRIGAVALAADVSVEADVEALIRRAEEMHGPVDLFCSNAGIGIGGGPDVSDEDWQRIWQVNVMAHVYAARALVPGMLARGDGYLLNTASAAGLLTNLGALPYTVTKHAAVALAEWLSITYGHRGIKVSCLCPQGVRTPMLMSGVGELAGTAVLAAGGMLEPEDVAEAVVAGIREERFLILPHPEVGDYLRRKGDDPDRWLAGMRRQQARLDAAATGASGDG